MPHDIIGLTFLMLVVVNGSGILASYGLLYFQPKAYKIQDRSYTLDMLNQRMKLISLNLALLFCLTFIGLSLFEGIFSWSTPPFWVLLLQVFFLSLVDDGYFYFYHRFLHVNKWAYRKIHRIHHRAFTPVPMEYIYVHPLEWFGGMGGPAIGLGVLFLMDGSLNAWVFLVYSTLRTLHELDIHSGIKSTWSNYLPFYSQTEHHDLHHAKPHAGNYASTYTIWDKLLKTEAK